MSLRFETKHCAAGPVSEDTPEDEARWLDAIVWTMTFVDLTRVEVEEFLWRVRYLEKLGYGVSQDPIPVAMIRRWEGLTVNVVTTTRTKFLNRWKHELIRDIDVAVRVALA